jgi:hypothetical protein
MGPVDALRKTEQAYGRPDRALVGYASAMGVFAATAAGAAATAWRTGRRPPQPSWLELAMVGLATHKIARIVAKGAVTSAVRAPFTEFHGSAGEAELDEKVVGTGWRKAVGELVTCPFCLGPWVAGSLVAGSTFAPTLTRAATTVFSSVAISDFLQLGYAAAQQRTPPPEQRAEGGD